MASPRVMYVANVLLVVSSLVCKSYGNYPELINLSNELFNLDFDNTTNNIFIGGENVLLKVSPAKLAVEKRITTGPRLDYIDCYNMADCVGKVTDNRNKVLLVDNIKRHIITCGSLRHGVCQLRSFDTLLEETNSNEFVVSNALLPAVLLITPWDRPDLGKRAMYVGTSWDGKYEKRQLNFGPRPAVSTRNIDGSDVFALSEDNIRAMSFLQFSDFKYAVKYVYGFSSGNFNYFVSVQETTKSYLNKNDPKVYNTFIIRLCQQDIHYLTYVELPLDCQSSSGTKFSIAQSAFITKPGGYFAKLFRLQATDDVLVVAFSDMSVGWDGPSQNSTICVYPVKEINMALASDQQKCVNGTYAKEALGLPWVADGNKDCAKKVTHFNVAPYSLMD